MYQRKANGLLIVFSALGGLAGFATGEALLAAWEGRVPNALLIAAYCGQLAFFVGLMCLLAELISPALNGKGWRLRYAADGWKLLVPATLLLLFAAGAVLQLLYGLNIGRHQPPQNIIVAIDVSESMAETDPNRESFRAAKQLVSSLESGKRVALLTFNNTASLLQPLAPVADEAAKSAVADKLDRFGPPSGGTNIEEALAESMRQIETAGERARASMVILISDGFSEVDMDRSLSPYRALGIAVHTVGVNAADQGGNELLQRIAQTTDGTYYSVDDVQKLTGVFAKIYKANRSWHLVGERPGTAADSGYYGTLRVLSFIAVGLLMGLSLGIVFDNRYLARSFSAGGALAGLAAGLLLELGLRAGDIGPSTVRAAADLTLALVLSASTLLVAYKERGLDDAGVGPYRRGRKQGEPSGRSGFDKAGKGSRQFR
ncbi:vWA domain-containing protein [Paenibacillus hodogayensis]|uniref:VWA domain-containing protein n=1 Tax=Paenibacillus hodogayensis TaxID=279208 RepID=A0ABV5VR90_9BACL